MPITGLGVDLSKPGSVAAAVTTLAVIVAVHEAGHFLAARLQGIRVTRFAVGFGPTLWKVTRGDVEYCLNAVPLGGYVAFPDDEDPNTSGIKADDPDLLKNRPIPQVGHPTTQSAQHISHKNSTAQQGPCRRVCVALDSAGGDNRPALGGGGRLAAARRGHQRGRGRQHRLRLSGTPDSGARGHMGIGQGWGAVSRAVLPGTLYWQQGHAYTARSHPSPPTQMASVGRAESAFLPGVRVVLPDTPAAAQSAAARAGLRSGDVLLAVGGTRIPADASQVSTSVAAIRASPNVPVEVLVQRPTVLTPPALVGQDDRSGGGARAGSELLTLRVTPDAGADGRGRIGVQLSANTYIAHTLPSSPAEVFTLANGEFKRCAAAAKQRRRTAARRTARTAPTHGMHALAVGVGRA
jgi:membrane-associated protease RseP (regulator of RpoE activity)